MVLQENLIWNSQLMWKGWSGKEALVFNDRDPSTEVHFHSLIMDLKLGSSLGNWTIFSWDETGYTKQTEAWFLWRKKSWDTVMCHWSLFFTWNSFKRPSQQRRCYCYCADVKRNTPHFCIRSVLRLPKHRHRITDIICS